MLGVFDFRIRRKLLFVYGSDRFRFRRVVESGDTIVPLEGEEEGVCGFLLSRRVDFPDIVLVVI